ncbi:MAG: hypothetical protein M1813_006883 [Trichoglossum hirsutum]|nr:MAG: hypothetical protein M1813_006883 [Trichoglossum hirsutum]
MGEAPPKGYAKLAKLMGRNPEFAMFRRFGALNAQNLLYLQAELINLEAKLQGIAQANNDSGDPGKERYSRDWFSLSRADAANDKQWQTVLQIRKLLKEYNDALIQQTAMSSLQKPNKYDRKFLLDWIESPEMGYLQLIGQDCDTWENSNITPDLIALRTRHNEDVFSCWVTDKVIIWFHHLIGSCYKTKEDGVTYYSDTHILHLTSFITTIIASILPISSILILYHVTATLARLGIICGFAVIFSLSLRLFTSGAKGEIFTATAT